MSAAAHGASPPGSAPAARAWWVAAVALWAAVSAWPLLAGMAVANDDLKFVRSEPLERGVWAAISDAWSASAVFRPLDILVGAMCDPVSLSVGPGADHGLAVALGPHPYGVMGVKRAYGVTAPYSSSMTYGTLSRRPSSMGKQRSWLYPRPV